MIKFENSIKSSGLKKIPILMCLIFMFTGTSFVPSDDWENLLTNDLSKWETYLSFRHQNNYKGEIPRDEKGQLIDPIGYGKDPNKVFSIKEESGVPVLKISGEVYGCIFTKKEFENYHLQLKVRWGQKTWEPRKDKLKDSGILYHSVGECGKDYWRSWMLAQEFQIMEGHMGDYWSIANSAADIRTFIPEGNMNPVASTGQSFIPIGNASPWGGFCLRSADYESSSSEWTQIDLICFGDKSIHMVNGHVVMVLQNSRYNENGKSYPLIKGKIQLQSEAAEVYYKDIRVKQLTALPKEYQSFYQ